MNLGKYLEDVSKATILLSPTPIVTALFATFIRPWQNFYNFSCFGNCNNYGVNNFHYEV